MTGIKNALIGIYMILTVMMPVSTNGRPTRRFSSGVTTLALAAVVLMVAAGGASAVPCSDAIGGQGSCNCGDTVVGDYTFNANMNCAANDTDGLTIGASDITIDGADFTMTGIKDSDTCASGQEYTLANHCGIRNDGFDNVTIKNLVVTNFCTGIGFDDYVTNNTVEHCDICDNGINGDDNDGFINHGFHLIYAEYCNIHYNNISNNRGSGWGCGDGGNGIFIMSVGTHGGGYNEITHNEIINNTKSGVFTKQRSQYNHIAHNNITGPRHEEGGISLMCMGSSYNLVEWNNVSGNAGWGIELGGFWNNVNNNTIDDNGWMGVSIDRCPMGADGSHNNTIFNNSICRNGFDATDNEYDYGSGVWITPWCYSPLNTKLYNNTICDNRDVDLYNGDDSTTGDWNTGDTVGCQPYYDFHHAPGYNFTWKCIDSGPDLVIRDLGAYWVNSYNVSFTVYNQGVANATATSTTSVKIVNRNDVTVHEATYPIPALQNDTGHPIEIGPFNIANEPHTIVVVADSNNDVIERPVNEMNNCSTDVFGAPDLIIDGPEADWVDPSMKQVNLTYTVRNVGDANITAGQNFSVCVEAVTGGSWGPCCEVVQGPLNVSESYTGTIGPVTVDTGYEKVRVHADYNNVIIENDERCEPASCPTDNCDYRTLSYPGPCLGCGDVDCGGTTGMSDAGIIISGTGITCEWAADVDRNGVIAMTDAGEIIGGRLNCYGGMCS